MSTEAKAGPRCEQCGDTRKVVPKDRARDGTYWCRNIPACSRRRAAAANLARLRR
jgi:ssDNA-binding Zn-finger/Zn-ribbon topoisomerase 1